MTSSFSVWLFEASVATVLLAACYKFSLEKLTFFEWNRAYLLLGMLVCLLLPLLPAPLVLTNLWSTPDTGEANLFDLPLKFNRATSTSTTSSQITKDSAISLVWLFRLLMMIYFSGVIYKTLALVSSLHKLYKLKGYSVQIDAIDQTRVFLQNTLPTFSFFNNIFLNERTKLLSKAEVQQIMFHERVHIIQKHSYDVILYEIVNILFWFNPCVSYLSGALKQVHEYLVDREVSSNPLVAIGYGELLIKLASQSGQSSLINTFSDSEIFHRITMLTKPQSNPMQKLKFLSVLPIMGSLIALSSFTTQPEASIQTTKPGKVQTNSDKTGELKIAKITWVGNSKYTSEELNKVLGIKVGDSYDSLQIENSLSGITNKTITSLYMDDGHLFFRADQHTAIENNKMLVTLEIFEGPKARIGKLSAKGNDKVPTEAVLKLIDIKSGEYFNRRKLILSQQKLAKSGKFDPKNIIINPSPDLKSFENGAQGLVDVEYVVTEI